MAQDRRHFSAGLGAENELRAAICRGEHKHNRSGVSQRADSSATAPRALSLMQLTKFLHPVIVEQLQLCFVLHETLRADDRTEVIDVFSGQLQ